MSQEPPHIDLFLKTLFEKKGSDLHIKVGAPPIMRFQSKLSILDNSYPIIDPDMIENMVNSIIGEDELQREKLRTQGSTDISYGLKGVGRFRFNIFFQRGSLRIVVRYIPHIIPTFDELNLPKSMLDIIDKTERGLVLITGATGCGKSTTLASMINHINNTRNKHVITIEDPIEFLIKDHHSLITQRELGMDCFDPHLALKSALRQDPDIILFSELRSKETINTALMAAETGHLVFSTIHSQEAAETISRILSMYPMEEQKGIKLVLGSTLKAVFAQRLLPRKDETGSLPIVEILLNNSTIQGEIQKGSMKERIREIMSTSQAHWGMQTFDQHLAELLKLDLVTKKTAMKYASSPEVINMMASGISLRRFEKTGIYTPEGLKQASASSDDEEVKLDEIRIKTDSPQKHTSTRLELKKPLPPKESKFKEALRDEFKSKREMIKRKLGS